MVLGLGCLRGRTVKCPMYDARCSGDADAVECGMPRIWIRRAWNMVFLCNMLQQHGFVIRRARVRVRHLT